VIKKGVLSAVAPKQRELCYFKWSIVTDPTEIDGTKEYSSEENPDSMDNGDDDKGLDEIDNIETNGRVLETEETHHPLPSINPPHINTHFP
jgi:hypothetical protein